MGDNKSDLSDDNLRLLVKSMSSGLEADDQSLKVGNMLIRETVRFRDKLKEDTGEILTVSDTREALDALDAHVNGRTLPPGLTPEQTALVRIWIDRLTLFDG